MFRMCCFLYFCIDFCGMYVNSDLSLNNIDYEIFPSGKYFQQFLTFRHLQQILSVCPLFSPHFSRYKYISKHFTYYKIKNIDDENDSNMSSKCKAIDMNSIQYHVIHIIMTHDCSMYLNIEMCIIIITIIINIFIMHTRY